MSQPLPVVIEDNWEVYCFRVEEGPVFASFYAGAPDLDREALSNCARVLIDIHAPNENGGPEQEEAEVLWQLEDELTALLTEHAAGCVLVARLTHAGVRQLVFQLPDWDRFRPPVGLWMEQHPEYEIDVSEHEGWEFFDECVWPDDDNWMLIQDRHVVDQLIASGSDPAKDHDLDFTFQGDVASLREAKARLLARGYREAETTSEHGLLMLKTMPLDLDQIGDETLANRRLAEELGIEFDGWGAMVVE